MRVAFVQPRIDCNDGIASHIELLGSELLARGVELSLTTGLVTGQDVAAARYDVLRRTFPTWNRLDPAQLRAGPRTLLRLARVLRRSGADIVHAHGIGLLSMLRPALAGAGVPLVASYHPSSHGRVPGDFTPALTTRQGLAFRTYFRLFCPERLIAHSGDTATRLTRDFGIPPHRVARIGGGIDLHRFRPPTPAERAAARDALGLPRAALVCVLPGRLNLNKGHDIAVAAFDRLHAAHPGQAFRCLFPGAGAQEAEIRDMIARSANPATFVTPGFVDDMRQMYWASDIVVLPSRDEGFALVVAEAMASGCAAIRTPSGGCAEQIRENETGYAIPFEDPDALADRINRLLDPATLGRVRHTAAEHARTSFSSRRMADEILALYGSLRQAG